MIISPSPRPDRIAPPLDHHRCRARPFWSDRTSF
jgi:hypothetical protein